MTHSAITRVKEITRLGKFWKLVHAWVLACTVAGALSACGGDYAVDYAPVAGCADVDLDPSACRR